MDREWLLRFARFFVLLVLWCLLLAALGLLSSPGRY
jgi:hypothetical protein